jgi:hypothetical protein
MHPHRWKPSWVGITPAETITPAILSGIKTGRVAWFSFSPHQLTSPVSSHSCLHYYYLITPPVLPSFYSILITMSSVYDTYNLTDFYCKGQSDPSIDVGLSSLLFTIDFIANPYSAALSRLVCVTIRIATNGARYSILELL